MLFDRCTYFMPPQSQQDYWENQWQLLDLDKQIANAKNKAWWPQLEELALQQQDDDIILEAGCGLGQFVHLLEQMNKTVLGIDITTQTLQRTKRDAPHLQLQSQDITQLALQDQSVSLLISLGVVEHFPTGPQQALQEASRVLKPQGKIFITVPYTNIYRRIREPFARLKRFLFSPWSNQTFYQYTFSRSQFINFLKQQNFTIIQTQPHHSHVALSKDCPTLIRIIALMTKYSPSKIRRKLARFLDAISPRLFSHMLLVVAQKQPLTESSEIQQPKQTLIAN